MTRPHNLTAPYYDGYCAGQRTDHYDGYTTIPECPYEERTHEHDLWWEGFGDGTKDYIAWQNSDY